MVRDKLGNHLCPSEGESTAFNLNSTCENNFLVAVLSPHYNPQRAGDVLSLTEKMLVFLERDSASMADRWISTIKGEGTGPVCNGSRRIQIKDVASSLSRTDHNPLLWTKTYKEARKSRSPNCRKSVWNSGRETFKTTLLSGCVCLLLLRYLWSQLLFVKM